MENENKKQRIIIIAFIISAIVFISILSYVFNLNNSKTESEIDNLGSESASTQMGKSVNEVIEENEEIFSNNIEDEKIDDNKNIVKSSENKKNEINNKTDKIKENVEESKVVASNNSNENDKELENGKDITFDKPIDGEILKGYAVDSLVYSDTLEEWIVHNGVDIKADKTSVVSAAADGTVYAIKNDPRYGLTVIINHDDGYQTIYSNLLTAEFVVQGEEVKKGQSIGTVGSSATFEIAEEYHLHFELLQNNQYLDPNIYINFE